MSKAGLLVALGFIICAVYANLAGVRIKIRAVNGKDDLQHKTYKSPFHPVELATRKVALTPFFSPDHSVDTETYLVQRAKRSIDISIPSVGSWHYCHKRAEGCGGCPVEVIHEKETFPIFTAAVNALHKGLKVRLITNKYADDVLCEGDMNLLTYLHFAGASIRYYASTSFTHSKYISIDDEEAAVSSVNFSKTSILKNREAGIIISNDTSHELVKFTQSIFEFDFENGEEFEPTQDYPKSDIDIIQDKTPLKVNSSVHYNFHYCKTDSPKPQTFYGDANIKLIASPDYAYDNIMGVLNQTKKSLMLSTYELTHPDFCDEMIRLAGKGIDLKLFFSNEIYSEKDKNASKLCYTKLYEAGIDVKLSHKSCLTFSHQKYWIIDDDILFMSTGNWAPSDYPLPPYIFPPKGDENWRKTNRDVTIQLQGHKGVIDVFRSVFELDYGQAHSFKPE